MSVYRRVIASTASCPVRWQASWLGADGLLSVGDSAFALTGCSPGAERERRATGDPCHLLRAALLWQPTADPCQYQWHFWQDRQGVFGGFPAFTRSPVVFERKCGTPLT
eukprot:CAMPEP_0174301174 /NCGR_PEP_ID=MMETSP0809-20121228/58890_1 /TAXON_ID=73025 ORGANISM="Eutreptiella gymnastica-like, Strain CCMP1594" /NCGR_SAMPLE_ID=MMETSP0809 /ASSEMBLY_ACC=CAM_ASM_000658 /LENGTH=108 /DNA_ID=CAMNT_0015406871 /DNA_START=1337 /DNA_END=1664 /DNA_ORIENTATION=+